MLFFVATVTPFDTRGKVDLGRLRAHVLWLAMQGVDGFVPTAMSGELLYLSDREKEAVQRTVLDVARGRPVYPCVWDPSPSTTTYLCEAAAGNGASGVFVPPPLVHRVDDRVVRQWYQTLARKVDLPLLACHDPEHVATPVSSSVYTELRTDGTLAGLEDASGDVFRLQRLARSDPAAVYAGGDRVLAQARAITGLGGVISAMANAWPSLCLRIYRKREDQLGRAFLERARAVRDAGGAQALKGLLGMEGRMPLPTPPSNLLAALPPSEFPV